MRNKVLLTLSLLALTTSMMFAQKMDPDKMAKYQTDLMVKELDLSGEQEEKVTQLNEKYSVKMADLMNREGSMLGKMGEMKSIKKEKNTELEKVLTKEQMKKFEKELEPEIRKTMRKKMG
ncbi:MAG: hypothetical protein AAFQ20_06730 [Bacteroidota bacterium]